jgi:hypothetical protein
MASWRRKEYSKKHHQMIQWSSFYMRWMIVRSKEVEDNSIEWTDGPIGSTVGLSNDQFETRQRHTKTDSVAPDELTPWSMEASVYSLVLRKLTEGFWPRSLQHRMNRPTIGWSVGWIVSADLQRLRWRGGALDESTVGKKGPSVHLTLDFSVDVSQWLFGCLGLFIPPPLTHLMLLDCVEVQRSARHLEDHIQPIQVLNCSSIDLHILCVCA